MSEDLEHWGTFWLPSNPEQRVPGHLKFSTKSGGHLLLHKQFERSSAAPGKGSSQFESYERIVGQVHGATCVLMECFEVGHSHAEVGPGQWEANARVFVNSLLISPVLSDDAIPTRFDSLVVSLRGLAAFDGRNPFKSEFLYDDDSRRETLTATTLSDRVLNIPGGEVRFWNGIGSRQRSLESETLVSSHALVVKPDGSLDLEEFLDLFGRIREFLALAMHQDCRVRGPLRLRTSPPDRAATASGLNGDDREDSDDLECKFYGVWPRGRRHRNDIYNRVFPFDVLGPDTLGNWLALDTELGHVISRLASIRFTKSLVFEDALVRMVAAADSLHRHLTGQDRARSRTMLKELVEDAGPQLRQFIPDPDAWANAVINERDNAAHNKGLPLARPALASEFVESVYWLVLICLLKRAAAPTSCIDSVVRSQPFLWPMNVIRREFA